MTNEQLKYIDQLQAYAIKNPAWFWSDAEDASKARQWLYDNGASKIVDDIYNRHTPDDIKQKINPKKLSSAVRTKNLQDGIVEGQNAFLDTAGAIALRTAPIILATPAAVAAPGAVLGGIVGGTIGNEITNKLVNYLSNGKYSDWGSLLRGGKDYGQTLNTLADFTNPGAILLGGVGAKGGNSLYSNVSNRFTFNQALKNGQIEFTGPTNYTAYHQSDKVIPKFEFPYNRWDVKTHGADPNGAFFSEQPVTKGFLSERPVVNKYNISSNKTLVQHGDITPNIDQSKNSIRNYIVKQARKNGADVVRFEDIADNTLQGQNVLFATDNSNIKFLGIDPKNPISTAERLGIPKGERNQKVVPTTWRQGDEAIKMFRDYGGIDAPEGSPLMEQILKYVPEARERYGLAGNNKISDLEIAQSLYKRALQLSGQNNGAVYSTGEPIILFRGDTKRYNTLMPRMSPTQLASAKGTMDNSLGNLFLGEYPNSWVGADRYLGTIRQFGGNFTWEGSGTGSNILSKYSSLDPEMFIIEQKPRLLYSGTVGRMQRPISVYKAPSATLESGVNDLNAFIVRSPAVRDATSEISVLNDDLLVQGYKGTTPHMRTKLIKDKDGFSWYLHPDGTTTPALAGYDNRTGMAEHYNYVLNDARNKGQGLLMSRPGSVLRDEHSAYTYYALPNFNIRNAKHLLGYDLMAPLEKSWAIYRKHGGKLNAKTTNR